MEARMRWIRIIRDSIRAIALLTGRSTKRRIMRLGRWLRSRLRYFLRQSPRMFIRFIRNIPQLLLKLPRFLLHLIFSLLSLVWRGFSWVVEKSILGPLGAVNAIFILVVALIGAAIWSSIADEWPSGVTASECQKLVSSRGGEDPGIGYYHSYDRRQNGNVDRTQTCQVAGLTGEGRNVIIVLLDSAGEPVKNRTSGKVWAADVTRIECVEIFGGHVSSRSCVVPDKPGAKSRTFELGKTDDSWVNR